MMKLIYGLLFFITSTTIVASPLKISLITCGTGEELYASFGHSGIRIIDSANHIDDIYNYGMFNFSDPNFYMKFTRGTLLYYCAKEPSEQFMYAYQMDKREVKEQVLNLTDTQATALKKVLDFNNLDENKYYKYDFLFNNCSTKLRDIFDSLFRKSLVYQTVLPNDSLTFMGMLNSYLPNKHWERMGIDIILCSRVNEKMTNRESMFLPEWLSDNFAAATINGQPLVKETRILLPDGEIKTKEPNTAFWLMSAIGILFGLISFWKPNIGLWKVFDALLFSTLGLLGFFFLFMWFGADHVETNHNGCLLWALPTHVAFVYLAVNNKIKKYATISLILCLLSLLIIHPFIQSTALEIYPIIALIAIRLYHHSIWKKN